MQLLDTDNSIVVIRREGGQREDTEGQRGHMVTERDQTSGGEDEHTIEYTDAVL